MKLYLTILGGPSADRATPIVAITNQTLIRAVLTQIAQPELWPADGPSAKMMESACALGQTIPGSATNTAAHNYHVANQDPKE